VSDNVIVVQPITQTVVVQETVNNLDVTSPGPQGIQGPTGATGPTGPTGAAGANAVYDTDQAVISMQVFG
jgi:hypothetical protein